MLPPSPRTLAWSGSQLGYQSKPVAQTMKVESSGTYNSKHVGGTCECGPSVHMHIYWNQLIWVIFLLINRFRYQCIIPSVSLRCSSRPPQHLRARYLFNTYRHVRAPFALHSYWWPWSLCPYDRLALFCRGKLTDFPWRLSEDLNRCLRRRIRAP